MKEKQFDGDKGGEKWRTDTMNYLIGRDPDIESLLLWAEHRSRQDDPRPIQRNEVDAQSTVNGIDPSVLDGHLWAFFNLNLRIRPKRCSITYPACTAWRYGED